MKIPPCSALLTVLFMFAAPLTPAATNIFPTSGNVGIGTLTPGDKLQVIGNMEVLNNTNFAAGTNYMGLMSGTTPQLVFLRSVSTWSDTWWNWTMGTDNKLRLGFSSVPQLTIQNGAFGLGTDSPLVRLHVNGDVRIDNGGMDLRHNLKTTDDWPFRLASNEDSGWNEFRISRLGTSKAWTIQTSEQGVSLPALGLQVAGGNVGIGTASPGYPLHVVSAGTGIALQVDSVAVGTNPVVSFRRNAGNGSAALGMDNVMPGDATDVLIFPYIDAGCGGGVVFYTAYEHTKTFAMGINGLGNVGIGTTSPTEKLAVNGRIRAKEVVVETNWSDYVFDPAYRLAPLSEIEQHIRAEKHLPGIPSAQEIAQGGVSLGDMQARLLQKVEELTLHAIEQEKEIQALKSQLQQLQHH